MSQYAAKFWQECDRYHDLAERYERDIEVVYPPFVTSNGVGSPFIAYDAWCASNVIYYEHRGERV